MVRIIRGSGCEHDLLEQIRNLGVEDCHNLSDIDIMKKKFPERLQEMRIEKKTQVNSSIHLLEQEREEIRNTYSEGFNNIIGWFKRIPPSVQIFSNQYQLRRYLNKVDKQEQDLHEYFRTNNETMIGARGELEVINELQKLPDEYVLINDYKVELGNSVHWNKYNEYVQTAQIDHLILSPYGIFILETKNWSQQTFDQKMRIIHSPIWQLDRHNFALWYRLRNTRFGMVKKFNILVLTRPLCITQPYINFTNIVPISDVVGLIQRQRTKVLDERDVERLLRIL